MAWLQQCSLHMSCIDTDLPCGTLGISVQSHDTKHLLASNELQLPLVICGKLFQVDAHIRNATLLAGLKVILHVVGIWLHGTAHVAKSQADIL
jgi:hypothetical protein